jgi:GNAT superfamily N-acetyltransferase
MAEDFPTLDVRKLVGDERELVQAHFLRLDPEARRTRFFAGVSDIYIEEYCRGPLPHAELVLGAFVDGVLRGVGELYLTDEEPRLTAEIALSVETEYQDRGVGTVLLDRLTTFARNRAVRLVRMVCLTENRRMRHLTNKFGGRLLVDHGEVTGQLATPWPTGLTMLQEALADGRAMIHGLMLEHPAAGLAPS